MVPSRQKARYKLVLLYQSQGRTSDAYRLAYEILTEKDKSIRVRNLRDAS